MLSRWGEYLSKVGSPANQKLPKESINDLFPFHVFFANAPKPLFKGESFDEHFECAMSCWRYITDIFTQLDEFWAFELLRSGLDRTRYLCVKEAKIIAMTCTHAALKRQELVDLGFRYDKSGKKIPIEMENGKRLGVVHTTTSSIRKIGLSKIFFYFFI